MVVVTNARTYRSMVENLVEYLTTNIHDPQEVQRLDDATQNRSNAFVSLKDGQTDIFLPQILVELPSGESATNPTGIVRNTLREPTFGILVHVKGQLEAIDMADEIFNSLRLDTDSFFEIAKMYLAKPYITNPSVYPHESNMGEWYAKLSVTFSYFHFGSS